MNRQAENLVQYPEQRPVPLGLGLAGKRLWRRVVALYALAEHEAEALAAACRMADDLARLEEALKDARVMTIGSRGQSVVNPIFSEVRAHRLALTRLLFAAGLDAGEIEDRSTAARRLARRRWQGRTG
jgi:hypothetical protein